MIPLPTPHPADQFIPIDLSGPIHSASFINSLVVPRPIALVTTHGPGDVVNAAPFSYFNIVCTNPPMIMIAIERRKGRRKDTSQNIVENKEFVVNICSVDLAKAVSVAGGDYPPDCSEIELTRLSLLPSSQIEPPRIANTLAQLECVLDRVIELGNDPTDLILGRIVGAHAHASILQNGVIDIETLQPLARLSGAVYAKLFDFFAIPRGLP